MHHHHPSTSTVGVSSLCDKVGAAVAKPPRTASARPLRPSSSPFSSTNLLRNEGVELFFLTRPASGRTSRSVQQPEFLEDPRTRVPSARTRREPETPADPSAAKPDVAVDPCVAGERPIEIPGRWKHNSPSSQAERRSEAAGPLPSTDAVEDIPIHATRNLPPADILHLLRTRGAQPRRPSKVPTPPAPPKLVDLVGGQPSERRTSVFGRPPAGYREREASEGASDDRSESGCPSSSGAVPSACGPSAHQGLTKSPSTPSFGGTSRLHAAMLQVPFPREAAARDTRNDSSFSSLRHGGGVSDFWTSVDNEALLSPNRERKRALCEKLHLVGVVHGGVVLDVPLLLDMPHYQSLHPVDGIVEALPSELPLSLRVTQGGREHSLLSGGGPLRGFLTSQQLLRESRATNFVVPKVYNPSPFVVHVTQQTTL